MVVKKSGSVNLFGNALVFTLPVTGLFPISKTTSENSGGESKDSRLPGISILAWSGPGWLLFSCNKQQKQNKRKQNKKKFFLIGYLEFERFYEQLLRRFNT